MAVKYGYFNSIDGDRTYNADDMSEYFDGLISNGVYESVGGALQVTAGSGMTVNVATGRAIVNCKWISNNSVLNLSVTAAHAVLDRYTAVVVRLDISNRLMTITTKDGTPASSPVKPSMTNNNTTVEICLAYIYVGAGVTSISQSSITDMRASDLCGWVTGIVQQVDTSQLFLQWQTAYEEQYQAFETWFSSLTDQLRVDTYIQQFRKRVVLSGGSSSNIIPLDMAGYTFNSSDVISVYINGLYAAPEVDYIIDLRGDVPQLHPNASAVGTEIYIVVLKSKIGYSNMTDADSNTIVTDGGENITV